MGAEVTEDQEEKASKQKSNVKIEPEKQPLLTDSSEKVRSERFSIGFIEKRKPPEGLKETFNTILHTLIFVLSELGAGPIEFQDVLGVRR